MPQRSEHAALVKLIGGIVATLLVSWLGWVSSTLIKVQEDIAVLKYSVFKIAKSEKADVRSPPTPSFAVPLLPLPHFTKELKNETNME